MKTFLNLKQCLILFAAVFSLTSCLKSDDPDFQIAATGYINQTVTEEGEGEDATTTNRFSPVIIVYGNGYIKSCTASGSSSGIMIPTKLDDYGANWQITSSSSQSSSELPKETYSISATNTDGDPATFSLSFSSITKSMKGKLKGDIVYDSQTKKLTFNFDKVENATEYLLIARTSGSASLYQSAVIESYTAEGEKSLEEATFAKKLAAGNTYTLTIVAITGTSSNGNFRVVQEGKSTSYSKAE